LLTANALSFGVALLIVLTCLLGVGLIAALLFSTATTTCFRFQHGGDSRLEGFVRSLAGRLPGRGQTAYQVMGILAVGFALALTILLPSDQSSVPQLAAAKAWSLGRRYYLRDDRI